MEIQKTAAQTSPDMIRKRYGDGVRFAATFGIGMELKCLDDEKKCFTGVAPRLSGLCKAYPADQVNTWILAHLMDLYKFTTVREKPSFDQLIQTCEIIKRRYHYLNAAELLLFFIKFKSGDYGQFYGSVDPMAILAGLREFLKYRAEMIDKYEREAKEDEIIRQREEWERKAVPMPDNLEYVKAFFKMNNNQQK